MAALAVVAFAVGVGVSGPVTRATTTALNVIVSPPTGTIAVGETITYPIQIENPGTDPVTLTSYTSSLGDPVNCPTDQTIAAGGDRLCSTDHVVTAADITNGTLDVTVNAEATVSACNVGPLTPELLSTSGNAFEFTGTFEGGQPVQGYQFNGSLKDANGNEAARFYIQVESNGDPAGSRASLSGNDITWQFDNVSDAFPPSRVRYVVNAVTDGFVAGGTITTDGMPPVTNGAVNDATGFAVAFDGQATGAILLGEDQPDEVSNANAGDTLAAGTVYNLTDTSVTGSEAPQYTVQYAFNDIVAGDRADFWFNQFGTIRYEQHLLSLNLTGCSTAPVTVSGSGSNTISTWNPALTVVKSAPTGTLAVGETVTYSFDVTNSGNVELANIALDDPLTPDEACPSTDLAAGSSMTCSASYVITQSDVDSGSLDNTATVTGDLPDGTTSVSDSATSSAPIAANGSLSVTKTASPAGAASGATINYSIVATNTGNVTLTSASVDDQLTADESCPSDPIPPGASITCTATYTITQADADAGTVSNTATVTALDPNGAEVTDSGTNSYAVSQSGALVVTKTASPSDASLGDTLNYSIVVTNTGDVTLSSVAVDDALTTDESCPATTVAPGESVTCTATYTITQADADAGTLSNTANVSALDPNGVAVTGSGSNDYAVGQNAALTVAKSGTVDDPDGDGIPEPGDTVNYTITVTNTGSVTIDNIVVDDPIGAPTCDGTALAGGDVITCTVSRALTQVDIDAGIASNTAAASGTDPGGATVTASGSADVAVAQAPELDVTKSTTTQTLVLGDTINYTIVAHNIGNVTVDSIAISDPLAPDAACPSTTLAPGDIDVCTASYVVTQADIDAGTITNTATITGTAAGGANLSVSSTAVTPVTAAPALAMSKTGVPTDTDGDGKVEADETIDYTFVVTNTGNVKLTGLAVADPSTSTPVCGLSELLPGQMTECTASHILTQTEVNEGVFSNVATASALDLNSAPVSTNASAMTAIDKVAALAAIKSGTPTDSNNNGQIDVDEPIAYTITVTNTGNVTVDTIVVTDTLTGPPSCDVTTLDPGAVATCTVSYTLTQAAIDEGTVTNAVDVSGLDPFDTEVATSTSTTDTIAAVPALTLAKSGTVRDADGDGTIEAGEFVDYTITVTNSGNVTVSSLEVTDPIAGAPICDVSTLASQASATCTVSMTITQAQLDAGEVFNTATAGAVDPNDTAIEAEGTEITVLTQTPSIAVGKTGVLLDPNDDGIPQPGESIDFTITVLNTGNITLFDLVVTDPTAGNPACDLATIGPNAVATCTVSYTLTQADVDGGEITNIATATINDPGDDQPLTASDQATIPLTAVPQLSVDKTGTWDDTDGDEMVDAGETIDYTITVTNTGNVTIGSLAVTDPTVGDPTCDVDELSSGAVATCTVGYTIAEADIVAGSLTNSATATGTDPNMMPVSASGSTTTNLPAAPQLAVSKFGTVIDVDGDGVTAAGDQIRYMVMVSNTGNVTISNIVVDDPMTEPPICDPTVLPPGTSTDCAVLYTLTQADIDSRMLGNTATVSGTDPVGGELSVKASASTPIEWEPSFEVTKSASVDTFAAGSVVSYSIVVRNSGNVTAYIIAIDDPLTRDESCPSDMLAPGVQMTCTASYILKQSDVDAGSIDNTATVSGTDPDGGEILATASATTPFTQTPELSLAKTGTPNDDNANGQIDAGDTVSYVITATNSGNVTLADVAVIDPLLPELTCDLTSLLPGELATCRGSYPVTQSDIDAGEVVNLATATATDPNEVSVTAEVTETTAIVQEPQLAIDAVGVHGDPNDDGIFQNGETIEYSATVTNTGNVGIDNLAVSDPTLGTLTCDQTALAPGQSATCTTSYPLTQGDIDFGRMNVSPTAAGLAPGEATVTATDQVNTTIPPAPTLTVLKSADVSTPVVGDTITYTISVTNSGNVTIANVVLTDELTADDTCSGTAAAPGETIDCTGTHVVTQADVDSGELVNTATVTGKTPAGDTVEAVGDTSTTFESAPAITAENTANLNDPNADGIAQIDETIDYTITVTNTGNVTLDDVAVDDPAAGPTICAATVLAPGAATDCTATYAITAADIDSAGVDNTATASASAPDGSTLTATATASTPLVAAPGLTLTKTGALDDVNENGMAEAGEAITYTIVVTNTGNVSVNEIAITDTKVPSPGCDYSTLAAGESVSCIVTYPLSRADVDSGSVSNTATASGTLPSGDPIVAEDTAVNTLVAAPKVDLIMSAQMATGQSAQQFTADDAVEYTYIITNTGNVTLADVAVTDDLGLQIWCPSTRVLAGRQMKCTASYPLTQADMDTGNVTNAGNVSGSDPTGTIVNDPAQVDLPLLIQPGVSVVKSGKVVDIGPDYTVDVGDSIEFVITVTNTGNVTITDLVVEDSLTGPPTCDTTSIVPGQVATCTVSYSVSQTDLDEGVVDNTASVTASQLDTPVLASTTVIVPAAAADTGNGTMDTPLTIDVLSNDSDLDPDSLRLMDPSGNPVMRLEVPGEGIWTVWRGVLIFSPVPGFTGETKPVTYMATSPDGIDVASEVKAMIAGPTATTTTTTGPDATTTTDPYVPATTAPYTTSPYTTAPIGGLPGTGMTSGPMVGTVATLLIALGATLLVIARRRRTKSAA